MVGTLTGMYRGVVTDINDPSKLCRLGVSVPAVMGVLSVWAFPCKTSPSVPIPGDLQVGDGVWVQFEGGDSAFPVWVGFFGPGVAGQGGNEVIVQPQMPTDRTIELWVDTDNDLGNSGWDALDYRYVQSDSGTMRGTLHFKPTGQGVDPDAHGEIEARTDGGMTLYATNTAGSRQITLVANTSGVSSWLPLSTLDGFRAQNGYGGALTFEITKAGVVRCIAAPTAADHVTNKAYVDGRVVVATTAPSSPTVGQLWCPI